ncbi:unnamed protein product [Vitrella brassicaformis CCMP3155]|uniref:CCHC-type domain-containing protein n=1 Tax=Vitrella brassicaformis (strain CCMP3155) TaxID=1169540 RepID=A0A0G4GVE7_VITBC|nr:unnamed protein product [Vitrella brassicaformis CCMP3155]|eukprot:CEM34826.1 unnamed protein product [Vitrella brassicaformis CCMP3155]
MDTDSPPVEATNPAQQDVVMSGQDAGVGGGEGSAQIQPNGDGNAGAAPNGDEAGGEAGQPGQGDGNNAGNGDVVMVSEEQRAAALSSIIGAHLNQREPQQAGHTANNLTLTGGVVTKKAAESVVERKKLKLHTFTGDQAGFPTFAFEVQSKCYAAKIGYLLDKSNRQAGRAIYGTVQYDADNAHLHTELIDALMGTNDEQPPTNPRALAVVQQGPAGNGAAAWDALLEAFQPTHAGAWGDAFARVVNWQPDLKGTFEEAVTSFTHVVQRANELRQLQGMPPIADREMVEFFILKLPASFGRVREAVVIDPSAKHNFATLLKVCRQWADFTGSATQQQGQGSGSTSAAAAAGGTVAVAQKVSFVPIARKKNKGKKATKGQPTAQPSAQTGVSQKSKQTKASKDASSNGGKAGKGKKGKGLKCWICDSTEHLCRNCPKRDNVKHLLAQQMDTS